AGQPYRWTSALPAPSSQPNSRSITRGTYRGNNTTFTYNIPRSALVAGTNTIDISVNSGSGSTGFLSTAVVYHAIDFLPTVSLAGGGPDQRLLPPAAGSPSASPPDAPWVAPPSPSFPSGGDPILERVLSAPFTPADSEVKVVTRGDEIGV